MTDAASDLVSRVPAVPLPGNTALRDWFHEQSGRRGALARILGLSSGTVGGWGREKNPTRPHEPTHLFVLEQVTGIPLAAWISAAELEALSPVVTNWETFVFRPAARRPKTDPRQMHMDELLTRSACAPTLVPGASDPPAADEGDLDLEQLGEVSL